MTPTAPPTFPTELVALVLANINSVDVKTLDACCRVSKTFASVARPLLYKHLRVTISTVISPTGSQRYVPSGRLDEYGAPEYEYQPYPGPLRPAAGSDEEEVLRTDGKKLAYSLLVYRHLGSFVRSVTLTINQEASRAAAVYPALTLASLTQSCPNLSELTIRGVTADCLLGLYTIMIGLRHALRSVDVGYFRRGSFAEVTAEANALAVMLSFLPHLQTLRLTSFKYINGGALPQQSQLQRLTLGNVVPSDAFAYLLSSSRQSLRYLDFVTGPITTVVDFSMYPNLRTLVCTFQEDSEDDPHEGNAIVLETFKRQLATVPRGSNLRELTLDSSEEGFSTSHLAASGFLDDLPECLHTLDLSHFSVDPSIILTFLASPPHPALRHLVLEIFVPPKEDCAYMNSWIQAKEEVESACAAQGIECEWRWDLKRQESRESWAAYLVEKAAEEAEGAEEERIKAEEILAAQALQLEGGGETAGDGE